MRKIPVDPYKNFVRWAVVFFYLLPAALIAFNYRMDPNCRHSFSVPAQTLKALANSDDLVLSMPANYDDRALLRKFIPQAIPPEIVLLGGSRVLNVQAEFFREPWAQKTLNAGVTAGTIRDYIGLWQMIERQGFRPKIVFLCIEEQSLNSISQNDRYLSIYEYYTAFYEQGISMRPLLMGVTSNLKDLLAYETTRASVKLLFSKNARNSGGELMPRAHYNTRLPVRTHSFSMLYPSLDEGQRSPASTDAAGQANGVGEARVFEKWNRSDTRGYDHLKALLRRIKRSGAKPVLIGMPYHPEAYRMIRQAPEAYANMICFVEELKKIAAEEGVFFYDAIETRHQDFNADDFLDGVHLSQPQSYRLFSDASRAADLPIIRESFLSQTSSATALDKTSSVTGG